jgi:hypothetical protein
LSQRARYTLHEYRENLARSDVDRRGQGVSRARYDRRALREAGYCRSQQQKKYRRRVIRVHTEGHPAFNSI